jgi:phosphoribosylformylglycinamidine synthase subunit PurS
MPSAKFHNLFTPGGKALRLGLEREVKFAVGDPKIVITSTFAHSFDIHEHTMQFIAEIDIMPHKELLDPQGKAVMNNLKFIDLEGITDVRMGKHVTMSLTAANQAAAEIVVEDACKKLLANTIMESYRYVIKGV